MSTPEYENRAYFLYWLAHNYWSGMLERFGASERQHQFADRMSGRFERRSCAGCCCCREDGICLDQEDSICVDMVHGEQLDDGEAFCFIW